MFRDLARTFLRRGPGRWPTAVIPLGLAVTVALGLAAGVAADTDPAADTAAAETAAEQGAFELGGDAARALPDYEKYCSACHGPKGEGDGPMGEYLVPQPKDLTNTEYMKTRSDEQLYRAIRDGGAEVGLSDKMAPWKHLLSDQQIRDLAAYVRTLSEPSQ